MGEVFNKVDLNEVLEKNPAAFEELKSIYSVYAHDKRLPLIIGELNSKEKIPKEFIDGRIIIARTKNGDHSLLLFNPEIKSKFGIKYIKCSDIYPDLCDLIEKDKKDNSPLIALRKLENSVRVEDKIDALNDTTRIKQITKSGKNAFRQSLKVGEKVGKGAKTVGEKALIQAGKTIGTGAVKAGKGFIKLMNDCNKNI